MTSGRGVAQAPWRLRHAARYAWPAYGVAVAVLAVGAFLAWQGWQQARGERAAQEARLVSAAQPVVAAGSSSCDIAAVPGATLPLPEPATVLTDLRRAPASTAAALTDLRFERVPATPSAPEQLHVSGTLQGPYAAGKEALKSVLERYPGAVLGSLRLQRQPSSPDVVQWAFSLQFWALPTRQGAAPGCASLPTTVPKPAGTAAVSS